MNGESEVSCHGKLQTLVYNILAPTTAIFAYAIGLKKRSTDCFFEKLSVDVQFFVDAQMAVSL